MHVWIRFEATVIKPAAIFDRAVMAPPTSTPNPLMAVEAVVSTRFANPDTISIRSGSGAEAAVTYGENIVNFIKI